MMNFEGSHEAAIKVRDWIILHQAEIPDHLRERLVNLTGGATLTMMTSFVHAVYANRDAFSDEAKDIAGGVADLCDRFGFHGRLNGEAPRLAQALWRDAGEPKPSNGSWPAKADDPEPRNEFMPPEPAADGDEAV